MDIDALILPSGRQVLRPARRVGEAQEGEGGDEGVHEMQDGGPPARQDSPASLTLASSPSLAGIPRATR